MSNNTVTINPEITAHAPNQTWEITQLALAHLVNDAYFPVLMALQPILITTLGYSYSQAALLVVTYSVLSSLLQPVFGLLADKKGFRVSISLSVLLSGCGIALLGQLSDHYLIMLGCVALSAVGAASFHPGALCKVGAIAALGNRGKITSFFIMGGNLGQALGPLLAGVAIAYGSIQSVTWLIIPAIIMAIFLLVYPIPDVCPIVSKTTETGDENWKPVIILFAGSTMRMWVNFGAMTFLPTFLVLNGYPILEATMLISVMLLSGVAGQLTGGVLSDRIGRKPVIVITTFATIPAFTAILFVHGFLLILAIMAFGFFLWSSFAVTIAMAHELMPTQIGLVSGLFLGIAMGAGGIGVSISGVIADRVGLNTSLFLFPVLILATGLLFWMVKYSPDTEKC
jgi:FSR family fosmidomycin resistance protein-like MFS transporter